jgi:hypothetical protein
MPCRKQVRTTSASHVVAPATIAVIATNAQAIAQALHVVAADVTQQLQQPLRLKAEPRQSALRASQQLK